MRGSSINFKKCRRGALNHNDRTEAIEAGYLLPEEYRLGNEFDLSASEANKKIKELYAQASNNYQKEFGQKLQAKTYLIEAVANLDAHHTLYDVKKMVEKISKITGFTCVQIAIHKDEGAVGKNREGEVVVLYNYHAHLVFFTLDLESGLQLYRKDISKPLRRQYEMEVTRDFSKNRRLHPPFHPNKVIPIKKKTKWSTQNRVEINKEVRRRFKRDGHVVYDREMMSYLQTVVAEALGMPRGAVSVESEAKRLGVTLEKNPAVRREHRQYRAAKKEEERLREEYENKIDILIQEKKALQAKYDKDILRFANDFNKLKERYNLQTQQVNSVTKEKQNIQKAFKKLHALYDQNVQKSANLAQENRELKTKIDELEKELNNAGKASQRLALKNKNLKEENKQLKELVYSNRDAYIDGKKTGGKLTFKRLSELREEKITYLEKLAYTGEKYPVEFDDDGNPIKFKRETWKEKAERIDTSSENIKSTLLEAEKKDTPNNTQSRRKFKR